MFLTYRIRDFTELKKAADAMIATLAAMIFDIDMLILADSAAIDSAYILLYY